MTGIRIAIEIFAAVFEMYVVISFFDIRMERINGVARNLSVFLVCVLLIAAMCCITDNSFVTVIGVSLAVTLCSVNYKASLGKRAYCIVLIMLLLIASEALIGLLLTMIHGMAIDDIRDSDAFYLQGAALSKLALLLLMRSIKIKKLAPNMSLDIMSLISLIIIPISDFIAIYFVNAIAYQNYGVSNVLAFFITAILCLSFVASYYLMERQLTMRSVEGELSIVKKQYELQSQYYISLKEKTLLTNKNAHDIKNCLVAIRSFLEQGRVDEAVEKINQFYGSIPAAVGNRSGNITVDALVSAKMPRIKEVSPHNRVSVVVSDSVGTKIDEIDFCVLLGNALDNAVAACSKIIDKSKRYIEVSVTPVNGGISLYVVNSKSKAPKYEGSEQDRKRSLVHGYGITNMKEICEKYGGSLTIRETEEEFLVCAVLLPYLDF